MHVTADRDVCVGAGQCVRAAPDVFDQDEEGLVLVLRQQAGDDRREITEEAAAVCPSGAVRLT
ncbi:MULTISPECIES: ferredoxin [unclassified Streptomyces]|uniref:ferredoxin n=1 Tax=unclassified Streptomyces TaxID=2593676 RepID=UPI000BF63803|nr:ferredoxin [Streptomyces sp. Ru87]PGH51507.1 ferredoxin-1 [Streptomyces sp. Ru87]